MSKEFLEWFNEYDGNFVRSDIVFSSLSNKDDIKTIVSWLEKSFNAGYYISLTNKSSSITISPEEKEALSGWADLIESE